ncbi:MAG: hypothetical protein GDA38_19660 [Hormoscilla sp. SP12CHS1]|nr:hypothetical protein [Hormoscilla sp. SP12CHS1]
MIIVAHIISGVRSPHRKQEFCYTCRSQVVARRANPSIELNAQHGCACLLSWSSLSIYT